MIRINLLKSPVRRKASRPVVSTKALVITGIAVGLCICAAGVALLIPRILPAPRPAQPAPEKIADVPPPPMVNARIVEEVVRDVSLERDRLQQSGELGLPYEQLTLPEKINFQWLFAKNVCDLLIRVIPERIGLRSVEVENYATIYGVGLGPERDEVSALFTALKNEKVKVLPQPISFIRPNDAGGFRFGFGCEAQWGLQLADPFVDLSLSRLPVREALESTVESFTRSAKDALIIVRTPPSRVSAEKTGAYRRFTYRFTGTSSFVQFADFVKRLYDARMPCAFQSLKLLAQPGGKISIDGTVTFTTKE